MGQILRSAFSALQQAKARPTADQIAAVRQQWPLWTDMQISRHLEQRAELGRLAEQQIRQRAAQCLGEALEVRP